jgi:hypothetical protein
MPAVKLAVFVMAAHVMTILGLSLYWMMEKKEIVHG